MGPAVRNHRHDPCRRPPMLLSALNQSQLATTSLEPPSHPAISPSIRLVSAPEPGSQAPGRSEVGLLGGFRLILNDVPIATGPTVQRMLAALVCLGRQAPRNKLAHTLWPDASSQRAQSNLRTTLYRLQRQAPGLIKSTK